MAKFQPICEYGEHAAIVHYTSTPETDVQRRGRCLTDTAETIMKVLQILQETFALGEVERILKNYTLQQLQKVC